MKMSCDVHWTLNSTYTTNCEKDSAHSALN